MELYREFPGDALRFYLTDHLRCDKVMPLDEWEGIRHVPSV
jgi:hypothetical protein